MKFEKFLRTPFLKEHIQWLLLQLIIWVFIFDAFALKDVRKTFLKINGSKKQIFTTSHIFFTADDVT